MKKLIVLAVTAIVIAAVIFFGVKLIKATPKTADAGQAVAIATSVTAQTPAPSTATPKPATSTPATTTTSAPATATPTPKPTPVTTATPAVDEAYAFIKKVCEAGLRAEQIPAMAREEKAGYIKSVKLDDPTLTVWTALDLPLGDDPQWSIPTESGKPIVAGWAYMTRRVATVLDVVPDWYCEKHKAAKLSCEVKAEDYTLYKSVTTAKALKAFRLVRTEDGTFEWRLALCECGTTEKINGGPGGSSPTKKPTTPPPTTPPTEPTQKPQAPAHEPEPTLPPKTDAEHEAAPTLPPKQNDSDSKPNHSSPTLPPKQNGSSDDAPPMGGETW